MKRKKDKTEAKGQTIGSFEELQHLAPFLIEVANSDNKIALLALANPIIAIEDLGYEFTEEFRSEFERFLRFPVETVKQLEALKEQIHTIAGRSFDIDSPVELEHMLFVDLRLPRTNRTLQMEIHPSRLPTIIPDLPTALPPQMSWLPKLKDPLEELQDAHPIMKPLLTYRQLQASRLRLATPEVYEKIKSGKVKLPLTRVKFHMPKEQTHIKEVHHG
jgi:hypothetical protein